MNYRSKHGPPRSSELDHRIKEIENQPYKIKQFAGYLTGDEIRVTWCRFNENGHKVAAKKSGVKGQLLQKKGRIVTRAPRLLVYEYQNGNGGMIKDTVSLSDYVAGFAKVELIERGCGGHV